MNHPQETYPGSSPKQGGLWWFCWVNFLDNFLEMVSQMLDVQGETNPLSGVKHKVMPAFPICEF